jgi:hypothetical protein|tara:strand:+ start:1014 stop:1172 length:159 start_codon:yes stop_codon:yes gene_type:complete
LSDAASALFAAESFFFGDPSLRGDPRSFFERFRFAATFFFFGFFRAGSPYEF